MSFGDLIVTLGFIFVCGAAGYAAGHWSAVLWFKLWDRWRR